MIRILLLFCCFTLLQNDEETITWNESYKLTWDDFKGPSDKNSDAVAITASGITFSYSIQKANDRVVDFKVNIFTHFYPNKSWVKLDRANDHILAHEQLHFDITELHARKFKYQVSKLKASQNIAQLIDQLHSNINKAVYEMQKRYDYESDNSIIAEHGVR